MLSRRWSKFELKNSKQGVIITLQWRHNGHDGVSNHQPHDCLLNRLFRRRSKTTSKLRVTCLCAGNSPATGEFPAQRASNAESVSIWWRHHHHTHLHTFLNLTSDPPNPYASTCNCSLVRICVFLNYELFSCYYWLCLLRKHCSKF